MFVVCAFLGLGYRQCEKEKYRDGADKHRGSLSKITVANPIITKIVGSHSRHEYHRDNVDPPTAIQGHVSSKLRVEILQGPEKGESKDVLKSSVKLKEIPIENSKRETSEKKEAGESARSTTVNNELAMELFGKEEDEA